MKKAKVKWENFCFKKKKKIKTTLAVESLVGDGDGTIQDKVPVEKYHAK